MQSLPADADFTACQAELSSLEGQYYSVSISKQILFSDWYAHYKFFWQYQIDWVNEQKNFSLVRDKVPLTAWLAVAAVLVSIGAYLVSCIDTIKVCLGIA